MTAKGRCSLYTCYGLQVKVLRATRHTTGHFRDVSQTNLLARYGKTNLRQQKHTFTNEKECTTTQNKHNYTVSQKKVPTF